MLLTAEDAKQISERLIAASHADGCTIAIHGSANVNVRFARNSATSNGSRSEVSVSIQSEFGQRSGSVTTTSWATSTRRRVR